MQMGIKGPVLRPIRGETTDPFIPSLLGQHVGWCCPLFLSVPTSRHLIAAIVSSLNRVQQVQTPLLTSLNCAFPRSLPSLCCTSPHLSSPPPGTAGSEPRPQAQGSLPFPFSLRSTRLSSAS
ncbi:unnamed protein product [Rangifer tarandus platyrhynchus]|uniref:Uncharacterized protein n=2 Tax=Rangifer tarandus platyrhynchus TaxID=3082113 RepID=A0AC59YGY3_RANTA|nr:unnamed protein product [Rangifer tarandus platyrhynchus]